MELKKREELETRARLRPSMQAGRAGRAVSRDRLGLTSTLLGDARMALLQSRH